MNFTDINLDLQSVVKRTYLNLYYQSTFMNFLNEAYMEVARSTAGTPVLEVIKQLDTPLRKREGAEITSAITNNLATYDSVKVDLTQLAMDYSFRISPVILGANVRATLEGQMELKDSQIAFEIDTWGYSKLNAEITGAVDGTEAYTDGQMFVWNPTEQSDYIKNLNKLSAFLFNRKVYGGNMIGLVATEYANFVSALTSILKYETRVGVQGVDKGLVGIAYGVDSFQINDNAVNDANVVGYYGNKIACVGDLYFQSFAQYQGNYPGFPGYFVMEGNILFGAEVVRPEAIIKLVKSAA